MRADTVTLAERLSRPAIARCFRANGISATSPTRTRMRAASSRASPCCTAATTTSGSASRRSDQDAGYRENGVTSPSCRRTSTHRIISRPSWSSSSAPAKAGPDGRKPFFAYLAFTAPHAPLQAPPDDHRQIHADATMRAMRCCAPSGWNGSASLACLTQRSSRIAWSTLLPGIRCRCRNSASRRARWKSMPRWSTAWTRRSGSWLRR